MGKGEIACYEQFLLFLRVFKRPLLQTCKNQGLFEKGLNHKNMHHRDEPNITGDKREDGPTVEPGYLLLFSSS